MLPALQFGPRRLRASVGGRAGQREAPSAAGQPLHSCQTSPSYLQKLCKHQEIQMSWIDLSKEVHGHIQPDRGHKELTFKHQFPSFLKRKSCKRLPAPLAARCCPDCPGSPCLHEFAHRGCTLCSEPHWEREISPLRSA